MLSTFLQDNFSFKKKQTRKLQDKIQRFQNRKQSSKISFMKITYTFHSLTSFVGYNKNHM